MVEPAKLVGEYEAGRVTRHELLIRLCQAAAEQPPADLAPAVPADVLAEVRERSSAPPATPDGCRVFYMGGFTGSGGFWAQQFREESRRLYDGLWRWHRYFAAPGAPDNG